jgi:hypothetical protein
MMNCYISGLLNLGAGAGPLLIGVMSYHIIIRGENTTCKICLHLGIDVQGDQKVSVHLMITVQKKRKNILNSFNHLP